jgi:hypothetical protein
MRPINVSSELATPVVVVQVAAEGILADPDIAPIPAGRELIRRNVRFDTNRWLSGPIKLQ